MKRIRQMDFLIFIIISLFCFAGLIAVFSATLYSSSVRYGQERTFFLLRQMAFVGLGYILYFFVIQIDFRVHKKFAPVYILGVLGMLILVFAIGQSVLGAARWLDVGPLRLQPVEFAKIAIVIYASYYFDKLSKKKVSQQQKFIFFGLVGLVLILTLIQPDNGSFFIMLSTLSIMYIVMFYPARKARRMILAASAAIFCVLFVLFIIFANSDIGRSQNSHIITRFISWVNPFAEYETRGYQLSNSYIAISNGGTLGVGLGNGSQKLGYLPDGHTDFIVASMSEEFGLIAVGLIILGYILLLWRMMRIAANVQSEFGRSTVLGLTIIFFAQAAWNLAGVSGVLPLKGLTAPFLSYGGSSLFMLFILFAIIQNIYSIDREKRKEKSHVSNDEIVSTARSNRKRTRNKSV